jgi:LuxR family transcriptional regulator, maltose regulon positive regulatory protein
MSNPLPNTNSITSGQALIKTLTLDVGGHAQPDERPSAEAFEEEPARIVLPFVLVPLADLLERLPPYRTAHAARLITTGDVVNRFSAPVSGAPRPAGISNAELRVIRYLPSNLKAREIAAELRLSCNTVRTHIRRIYAKLDAHNRNEAVTRARELGLIPH